MRRASRAATARSSPACSPPESAFEAVRRDAPVMNSQAIPNVQAKLAVRRTLSRAQLQAVDEQGALYRHVDGRHRPGRVRRARTVDTAPPACRQRNARKKTEAAPIAYPKPDGVLTFDRLSSVFIQHQSRRRPAVPPDAERRVGAGQRQSRAVRRTRAAARRASTKSCAMTTGRAASANQRAELRALQDLRYQGSDAEHRVGHAGGRRRPELSEHVSVRPFEFPLSIVVAVGGPSSNRRPCHPSPGT